MFFKQKLPTAGEMIRDLKTNTAMIEHGWRFWPAHATDNEKEAAITAYLNGAQPTWYPEGFVEPPIDASGKLKEEERTTKQVDHRSRTKSSFQGNARFRTLKGVASGFRVG